MASTALALSLILPSDHQRFSFSTFNRKTPLLFPHKTHRFILKPPSSHSSSSSTTATTTSDTKTSSLTYSTLEDSFKTGAFLTNEELEKLMILQEFNFHQELTKGCLCVRVMRAEEVDVTVKLLAESFAESMLLPGGYVPLLRFFVKQYLMERRSVMPHAVTLVGFYKGSDESGEEELAGTVEVCFDKRGANASPPTPIPPKNSPYICNMTVEEPLRRKGIGWNLLKASEELIGKMTQKREVYLHCRMIDSAPFNMYTKAGYKVVQTDSAFVLLMLQRRKHLMCKKLPELSSSPEQDVSGSDAEIPKALDS